MKDSTVLGLASIGSLTIIEVAALFQGIDSALLVVVVGAVAGLGGYVIKSWRGS